MIREIVSIALIIISSFLLGVWWQKRRSDWTIELLEEDNRTLSEFPIQILKALKDKIEEERKLEKQGVEDTTK